MNRHTHEERHRAALDAIALIAQERARFTVPAVFVCLGAYILGFRSLGIELPFAIMLVELAVLTAIGALALAVQLRRVPLAWAHGVSAAALWCPLIATAAPMWATHHELFTTLFLMHIIAAGVLLGTRWMVSTLVVADVVAIALFLERDGANTMALISCVGAATVMAALVHVGMRRAFYNAETLRFEFRQLVESSPDAMFVHGAVESGFGIRWVNPAILRMLGYERPEELLGKRSVDVFVHPDDRARLIDHRSRVHGGAAATGLDLRWLHRDGSVRHVHAQSRPVTYAGGMAWLVVARDTTAQLERERERLAVEAAIRKSEEHYRLLFDGSPLPIGLFDRETLRFVAVNQKMVEVYGYDRAELLAMTVDDLAPGGALVATHEHVGVVRHRRKDGALLDIDVTTHQVEIDGRSCVLAIGVDVTAALRIEEQLRQAARMEAIGQLAGGVAHDFNNLLAAILSNANLVAEELGEGHPALPEVRDIEAATARATTLTRQLLTFSRKQPRKVTDVALNGVVSSVQKMLSRIVGEDIEMRTVLDSELGTVQADAGQLEQVLVNLVVNARDAMPTGGRLVIETKNVALDAARAAEVGARAGRYVMLSVSDTGCGMTSETQQRIFEPFFTTKPVGKGTGLGLATVFGIVKQTDGGIAVTSEVRRGTTFRVYLPRVDAPAAAAAVEPSREVPARGSETVLVVEDDPFVRSAVRRQLRALGYRTLEAYDAANALEVAAGFAEHIDLLLTDLVMPGMDGRGLAARLVRERPRTRVLFMSGYSEHAAVASGAFGPDDVLLAKPFTASALATTIRQVLDRVQAPALRVAR